MYQGCRIGAMTPFTAPGNASGRRCLFRRHYNYMYVHVLYLYKASNLIVVGTELLAPAKLIFNTPDVYTYH